MRAILVAVTFLGYLDASFFYVAALYDQKRSRWATIGALVGWGAQTTWLIRQAIILQAFPAVTLYDWLAFFVWLTVVLYLVNTWNRPLAHVGGFLFPILFLLWLISQFLSHRIGQIPKSLTGGWWIGVHIALATASYVAFLLSAVFSIMYLEKERELKKKRVRLFYYQLPPLGDMDALASRMVKVGVPLLTVAIYMGAVWAKAVWGHYWSWTAKETWSFITWLVYVGYLVARWLLGWRGHRPAVYTMTAFLVVVANFLGINLLFHGPHAYNF